MKNTWFSSQNKGCGDRICKVEIKGLLAAVLLLPTVLENLQCQTYTNVAPLYEVSALPTSLNFGSGASFYDYNNDGLDDLSFTMTNDSLRFYLNTGDGFELQPSYAFGAGESKQVLWVDYDNDGDLDFLLTINNGRYILYQNDGNMNFTDVSIAAGLSIENERHYGASFGDYDKDGDLDFYVCTYALNPGPNTYNANNHLYRNNGDGTFTDVTIQAGVQDGIRLSFQSVWLDYNEDGWLDLFVINDRIYANSLYKNNGDGTFTDKAAAAGIQFAGQDPMTNTIGDFDNDGDLDIYLTNTGIPAKQPKLLVNNGNETYTDQSLEHNVQLPYWTWGALWVDYNNDTFHDLYVCTGNPNPNELLQPNFFFGNTGANFFQPANSAFTEVIHARSYSPVRGDFNNDGFYDIAVLNEAPYDVMLWQNSGNDNNYIKITLHGTASNTFAISSYIRVYAGGNEYMQFTHCGENYLGQNSQHHIFGLAEYEIVDSVQVTYLSGHIDTYYDLEVNQWYHFTEGDNIELIINSDVPTNLCEGQQVVLDAGEHPHYLWNTGHDGQFLEVDEAGIYSVTVTNQFGVSKTAEIEVTVSPLPELLVSITNVLCAGDSTGVIVLQNIMGIDPEEVVWSNQASGDSISGLVAGAYDYIFTDINGCMADATAVITEPDPLNIQLFVQMENVGNDGSVLVFTTGGIPPYTVVFNGEILSGNTATGLAAGTYTVSSIDNNDCQIDSTIYVGNLSSTGNMINNGFDIFPNPARDVINIRMNRNNVHSYLEISDSQGALVLRIPLSSESTQNIPIDLSPGLYAVRLQTLNASRTVKLVVH